MDFVRFLNLKFQALKKKIIIHTFKRQSKKLDYSWLPGAVPPSPNFLAIAVSLTTPDPRRHDNT